jgi:DNA end-binding protein Ku
MARSMWSGSISFGLVNIPVKLYSATSSKTVRFHQLDSETGSRIRQQRVNEATGEEVPYERIVKGYELASGHHVLITDEELASLDPKASRTIDLLEFVPEESINSLYYDSAYYLGPDPAAVKPYALLLKAIGEAGKVGIAKFVMRGKEYLCALRSDDGVLVLNTMRYADEVREHEEVPDIDVIDEVDVSAAEVKMAKQLIESLDAEFDAARYHDEYREKVLELISAKERGEDIVEAPEAPEPDKVVDLMAALQASVAAAKEARGRHPSNEKEKVAPAKKAAPRKAAAKKAGAKKAPAKKTAARKAPARKSA